MSEIKVVTFDCYGTLIDWEGGAGAFLYDLARRSGDADPGPGKALRERWEELQFERLDPYRPYREVLTDSLSEWAGENHHRWNEHHGHELCASMGSWQPFPDTIPALKQAKEAGMKLVIISNTDRAIMDHTLRQLDGVEFDQVVVAEDVRQYKPGLAPFRRAMDLHPRAAEPGAARGLRLQVRHRARPAAGHADRLGEPSRGGAARGGAARPRMARPVGSGRTRRAPGRRLLELIGRP